MEPQTLWDSAHGHMTAKSPSILGFPRARKFDLLPRMIVPVLLGCLLFSGRAAAECVNYADYLHWACNVSVDAPAYDVAVAGTHAYVANSSSGVLVVDITNPETSYIVGSVDTPGDA